MSAKIRILDEHTINKIAAGEVIENPASVIKELVENALDAGADDILVEITAGGRQLIRVTDNGSGMSRDDALLCLERHATSKIHAVEDIFQIHSMGFRGEAVPSIAAVSKFTLLSCPAGEKEGTLIIVEGGRIQKCCSATAAPGTTVEVRALFFNVPVRKKFQRSPTYDASEIHKRLQLFALAYPETRFRLVHNQKSLFSVSAQSKGAWKERAAEVLGKEYMAGMCPLSHEEEGIQLHGFIGVPSFTRHNRSGQFLFVNHRPLLIPFVSFAVKDAYATMIDSQRHPVFLLYFSLPGEWIDINVHPQKKEARLRREDRLRALIQSAITTALERGSSSLAQGKTPAFRSISFPPRPIVGELRPAMTRSAPSFSLPCNREPTAPPTFSAPYSIPQSVPRLARVLAVLPPYFLVELSSGELSYMDGKATYARVFYERMQGKTAPVVETQRLLVPLTLSTNAVEFSVLETHLTHIKRLGYELEANGKESFMVKAIPPHVMVQEVEKGIRELLESLQVKSCQELQEKEDDRRLAKAAAQLANRAKPLSSVAEAQALVNALMSCKQQKLCPEGRPTMVPLDPEDIAEKFRG